VASEVNCLKLTGSAEVRNLKTPFWEELNKRKGGKSTDNGSKR
jgi:hypothetical protein